MNHSIDERCREHSRLITETQIKLATIKQVTEDMKENHMELKDAFWKVEGNLRRKIEETSKTATKTQVAISIIGVLVFTAVNSLVVKWFMSAINSIK